MLSISVVITTIGRPDPLKDCLEHLAAQTDPVDEVIVVDADPERSAEAVTRPFDFVQYIHFENGVGKMTGSRNIGLRTATGDIVAYLDDDANAVPGWATRMRQLFEDDRVGAAGGRALLHGQGKAYDDSEPIGAVTSWGQFTAGFEMDAQGPIQVDHLIGCNMAFRRRAVAALGGFHEFFDDACCTYEEVDLALRLKAKGYKAVFCSLAQVDHCPAKRVTGDRFNSRYVYGVTRNHLAVLTTRYGLLHKKTLGCASLISYKMTMPLIKKTIKSPKEGVAKTFALLRGIVVGLIGGCIANLKGNKRLVRDDQTGMGIQSSIEKEAMAEKEGAVHGAGV